MIIKIMGKVYPFKDKSWGALYPWTIKKVVGFDNRGHAKTELIGASFAKEKDAIEYCRWWNRKYFKENN